MNRRQLLRAAAWAAATLAVHGAQGAAHAQTPAQSPAAEATVTFPAVGVRLTRPEGFEKATSFDGFQQTATGASVLAARIPGRFAQVTAGFDAAKMAERGMRLQSKEPVKVGGQDGMLLRLTQTAAGSEYGKWIVAFGDATATVLVTATFPEEQAAKLSEKMKAAALSARPAPREEGGDAPRAPGDDLPFALTHKTRLKPTPAAMGKSLVFTKDGAIPAKSPKDPLFLVAPSLGSVLVADRHDYAVKRLQKTAHVEGLEVVSDGTLSVDGLEGYELVAKAKDAGSGAPLTVYQAMLFDGKQNTYILMQGLVGAELADDYLPEFKALARSLKRRQASANAAK